MKKLVTLGLVLTAAVFMLSGCNCYKKMAKKNNVIETKCNPQVLTLKGNNVAAEVTVTFPAKYFKKDVILKMTPVLVFEGGEIAGTPKFVQGENVQDNFTVISWKTGGSVNIPVNFPYDSRADISTLVIRTEAKCYQNCGRKYADYLPMGSALSVARGISTLQNRTSDDYVAIMADNFKKTSTISQEAQIMYQIQSAKVRPAELTTNQIKMLEDFVKSNTANEEITMGNVYSKGYASPEGPVALNDKLAKERSQTAQTAISKQLKGTDVKYDISSYGEDWDGFKALVEQSDIKDKGLILQVLQMYDNPVKRDQEIKNMSSVFNVLAKDILPQLRRTKLVATADTKALSDAELKSAVKKDISSLSVEELLYTATLVSDNAEKASIYKYAADKYNDARAYNNLGATYIKMDKFDEAKKALNKAAELSSAPEISNNLGAVAIAQGNVAEAKKYLANLNTAQAKANKGLIAIEEGDYATASKNLSGYDLAVAEIMNGNLAKAKSAIASDKSADADYLRAVISSREGDANAAIANLKSAIAKKPELKAQAKKDVEFVKLFNLPEFKAL